MISKNKRVVLYTTDYVEFTGSSPYSLDGCDIDNNLGPGVSDELSALDWERSIFKNADVIKTTDKLSQKFFLMSMATGVPGAQVQTLL